MARVTLQTIADQVGVSRMTVSNAFSRPDQLSDDLRRRILEAAEGLGYVGPDPAARALARGASGTVGVLLTDRLRYAFTDEVATSFLGAIADELAPTGLAITLLSSTGRPSALVPARDIAMDGAVVFSCDPAADATAWLLRRKLPMVFVDQESRPDVPSVNIDDRGGARAVAQHVVDLGHRRVGILSAHYGDGPGAVRESPVPESGHTPRERMLGWLEPLEAAGITPRVVQQDADAPNDVIDASARLLLDVPDPPTAVLCYSDVIAAGVLHVARELGLRVPDDLTVAGFDDNPLAARIDPPLTTVRQDSEAKGRAAVRLLTAAIEAARSGTRLAPEHVVLPTELIVRGSTAPPRA